MDKFWKPEISAMVQEVASFVRGYDVDWTVEAFESALEEFIKGKEWPMGKVMNATRLALAGSASGLGIADIIVRIGKTDTVSRIGFALERLG